MLPSEMPHMLYYLFNCLCLVECFSFINHTTYSLVDDVYAILHDKLYYRGFLPKLLHTSQARSKMLSWGNWPISALYNIILPPDKSIYAKSLSHFETQCQRISLFKHKALSLDAKKLQCNMCIQETHFHASKPPKRTNKSYPCFFANAEAKK